MNSIDFREYSTASHGLLFYVTIIMMPTIRIWFRVISKLWLLLGLFSLQNARSLLSDLWTLLYQSSWIIISSIFWFWKKEYGSMLHESVYSEQTTIIGVFCSSSFSRLCGPVRIDDFLLRVSAASIWVSLITSEKCALPFMIRYTLSLLYGSSYTAVVWWFKNL